MARKQTLDAILSLFKKLGGNTSEVLGTKTNVNFIGKGEPDILRMDLNPEALGAVPQTKIIEELKDSVSYAASGKLNDLQANKLLENMSKIDGFYNPPVVSNITDLRTGVRDLDREGLASLRLMADDYGYVDPERAAKLKELKNIDLPEGVNLEDTILPRGVGVQRVPAKDIADDLPPPGSRGGPEDIAAPFSGAGLEAIKNVKGTNLIVDDIVDKIYMNAGVTKAAQPAARGNAREFLNRIKDMEDPSFPGGTTLSSVMEADDFRFMTEGGGGGMGDPLLLVQKYFGPRVASSVAQLDSADDIQKFAERLVRVKDAKGNSITDRNFDPESVDPNTLQGIDVFDFADGGRVPFFAGMLVRGGRMGYQALRKYGIEGKDISRLYASLGTDKSLVGKEKTEYFRTLNKVLRNPDDFPDEIMEIQKQLGIDVGLGFKNGGLAGILEV
jgi:hypothetical protein